MTGRKLVYFNDGNGSPIVVWSQIFDYEESIEDSVIQSVDAARSIERLRKMLSPRETEVLELLQDGEPVPREYRNALRSLRRKFDVTNQRKKLL